MTHTEGSRTRSPLADDRVRARLHGSIRDVQPRRPPLIVRATQRCRSDQLRSTRGRIAPFGDPGSPDDDGRRWRRASADPAGGDRGPRRPARRRVLARPAHRLGQERRLLRRHPAAARRRAPGRRCSSRRCSRSCATRSRWPTRVGVRARRSTATNRDDWERDRAATRRRRRRPAARLARAVRQRAVPRRGAARRSRARSGCSWSTRRTASATGATTSGPTTGASSASSSCCRAACRCCAPPRPRTTASSTTSSTSSATTSSCSAARSTARASRSPSLDMPVARPSGWPGSRDAIPTLAGHRASSTPHRRRHDAGRRVAASPRHRRARATAATTDTDARLELEQRAARERAEGASSPPRRSAWASTSPTSRSSSTTSRPGSPIAYYQQVGRAGRALDHAPAVAAARRRGPRHPGLLHRAPRSRRAAGRGRSSRCSRRRGEPVSIGEIEARGERPPSRLEAMLKILEVEGAVERVEAAGTCARSTRGPTRPSASSAVTAQRRAEQAGDARRTRDTTGA